MNLIGGLDMWMLTHANGYALDDGGTTFDALVIDGDRICAVGTTQELLLQFGTQVEHVVDLAGATVVPGLVDSHLHVAAYCQRIMQLNLVGTASKGELLHRIRAWAAQLPTDAWIVGGGWDDNRFEGGGLPTLDELDEAAGGRPLLLTRICCHAYLANRAALRAAGIGDYPTNPTDGAFGRDDDGRFNGRIYENAVKPVQNAIPPMTQADWKQALKIGMQSASLSRSDGGAYR